MNKIKILLVFLILVPAVATANHDDKKDAIAVDIINGKIGDVYYRTSAEAIKKAIGGKRIKKAVEKLEGQPSDVFVINIQGHKIYKHWNATSFSDPIFKMRNGLSVGMKIKDFKKQYGEGEIRGGEGTSWCFESRKPKYYFCMPVMHEDDLKLNEEVVKEIWVW